MRRLYSGLLLCGVSVSAHASKAGVDDVIQQSGLHEVRYSADYCCGSSVVLTSQAYNSRAIPDSLNEPALQENVIGHTEVPAVQASNGQGMTDLSLLPDRITYKGKGYKFTLRPESATLETGSVNVSLKRGSTFMTWHKSI